MLSEKLYIGGVEQDQERCLRCGSMFLDTGWECTDCDYDNREHYCPPEIIAKHDGADK
jgi:hypothetical protein